MDAIDNLIQQIRSRPPSAAKPQQITEAEARQKAKAAGKDPEWYVEALRKRKLLKED